MRLVQFFFLWIHSTHETTTLISFCCRCIKKLLFYVRIYCLIHAFIGLVSQIISAKNDIRSMSFQSSKLINLTEFQQLNWQQFQNVVTSWKHHLRITSVHCRTWKCMRRFVFWDIFWWFHTNLFHVKFAPQLTNFFIQLQSISRV